MTKVNDMVWLEEALGGTSGDKRQMSLIRLMERWQKLLGYGFPFWVEQIRYGVPEGLRHESAVRIVGFWYKRGLSHGEVYLFLKAWNIRNKPPMSNSEMVSIFNSTAKWEQVKHTPYMSDKEVHKILREIRQQGGKND